MEDRTSRVIIGLLGMVVLWVGVYWWWPIDPPVSFAVVAQQPSGDLADTAPSHGTGGVGEPSILPSDVTAVATGDAASDAKSFQGNQVSDSVAGVIKPRFATHVVGKDETLETIALMYFGTRAHADAIARANPMLSPPDLKPGREILVPLDPSNVQGLPVGLDKQRGAKMPTGVSQEYMVQAGDSLAKIAKKIYGGEQFANLIFEANRDKLSEPSKIRVGQRLRIPAKPPNPDDATKPVGATNVAPNETGNEAGNQAVQPGGGN